MTYYERGSQFCCPRAFQTRFGDPYAQVFVPWELDPCHPGRGDAGGSGFSEITECVVIVPGDVIVHSRVLPPPLPGVV